MADTPYPLPRETRESTILAGNGTVGPYGPSLYKIFDTVDVKVFAKALGETVYTDVTGSCTIAKVDPAQPFDFFRVTFGAALPATTAWYHQARRIAERSVAVIKGGSLDSNQLEKELSKQATAQSEMRRDLGKAYSAQPGSTAGVIIPGAAGELMQSDAAGNLVPSGANPATLIAATAQSVAARDFSRKWASESEDVPVDDGVNPAGFSAFNWMRKALAYATSALSYMNSALAAKTVAESAAGANLANADSRAAAILTNIPAPVNYVRTAGYAAAGDGGAGLYKKVGAQPTHGGKFQSANGTWWELAPENVITPQQFGALAAGTDDLAGLQLFFDYIKVYPRQAEVAGSFLISGKLTIGQAGVNFASRLVRYNAIITTTFVSTSEAIRFVSNPYVHHGGHLQLICGGATWASRNQYQGIIAQDCSRTTWDDLYIVGVKRDGFKYEEGAGNMSRIGKLMLQYCGSGRTLITSNCTSHAQTGTPSSTNQREVLTLDAIPVEAAVNDFIKFDGKPYQVTAVNLGLNQITVFPWLISAPASGVVDWSIGSGLFAVGSNASLWTVGTLDCRGCGTGLKVHALYPPEIGTMQAATCGVGVAIGTDPTASSQGGFIAHFYMEGGAVDFQVIEVTIAPTSFTIGSSATSLLDTWKKLRANTGTADGSGALGVSLLNREGISYSQYGATGNAQGSTLILPTTPVPSRIVAKKRDTLTITLQETPGINALWGFDAVYILAAGTGANGQPTGTWTFQPEAGYTVNGVASVVHSGFSGQTLFSAYLNIATKDWILTRHTRKASAVSADKGNAAATLTVATSETTSVWNTPLTIDRAVTLSTTGASNGDRFRIVRTAAATGAFNLNVGTGPLKALAVGQWCDVDFNGTAWMLAASGPL